MQRNSWRFVLVLALLVVAGYVLVRQEQGLSTDPGSAAPPAGEAVSAFESGDAIVRDAFEQQRSDVWVEIAGTVERTLADDREGSAHQRWILRLKSGQTVLVAHNIDLAPRVPLAAGESIRLRGEYEWNERGGVVHWTHHDPRGNHDGGWVEHRGERYR